MPYLSQAERASLEEGRKALKGGDLNYQFSKLVNDFLATKGLSYAAINEVVGALECCTLEVYARIARPYEDKKVIANGEVFTVIPE